MDRSWITARDLTRELARSGIRRGAIVMVHSRLSVLPKVVGGAESVVRALLDSVGSDGTIVAFAGWEDNPYHELDWETRRPGIWYEASPPFDPAISEARHCHGVLPERIRTWPGATRSTHPEMNLVAIGARSDWITQSDLGDDPYGHASPLSRLVAGDALVLMLGAPLSTLTLIHHAECIATAHPKQWIRETRPVRSPSDGTTEWRMFRAIDTSNGAYDYGSVIGNADYVEVIATDALQSGVGKQVDILGAACYIFRARDLVQYARHWIETRFGG